MDGPSSDTPNDFAGCAIQVFSRHICTANPENELDLVFGLDLYKYDKIIQRKMWLPWCLIVGIFN